MNFEDTHLNNDILDALYDMHFTTCTPIQEKCIPEILNHRDVLGVAQTGTGKTAAYLLPILSMLSDGKKYPPDAVNCIIMSPTRELAQQIDQALQGFSYYLDTVSSVAVYGGNDGGRYDQELRGLRLGADIIIATPGRLISHINMGNADLSRVSFLILDEADRMLDMGFYDDIMLIASHLPTERQTIMFSATMPPKIEQMAATLLHDPVKVKISPSQPADKITQQACLCNEDQKLSIVEHLSQASQLQRAIIFTASKAKARQISHALRQRDINCAEMHSDLDQPTRDETMRRFKARHIDVLVATDIIARGIDIDDIQTIINYDVPRDPEDYVHRIGRTARAERDGQALTLVAPADRPYLRRIEQFLRHPIPRTDDSQPETTRPQQPHPRHTDKRPRRDTPKHRRNHNPRQRKPRNTNNSH